MNTIHLPPHWTPPKFTFGDRTKQGVIVGMEKLANQWRYALLPDKSEDDIEHLMESEITPLSLEEITSEIEAEIQNHQQMLTALKSELASLKTSPR